MDTKSPFPTVLITGASSGIGEAFAHVAAGEGHPLILVARSEAELHRVRGVVIARYAVPVSIIVHDLSAPGAGDALANELEARKLDVDIIINNAGFGLVGKAAELSRQDQLKMIDLKSRNNSKSVAMPRQIAMYLCKQLTAASLPEIGRSFGGKHHSTVIHSIKKVENLRTRDRDFNNFINNFIESFR